MSVCAEIPVPWPDPIATFLHEKLCPHWLFLGYKLPLDSDKRVRRASLQMKGKNTDLELGFNKATTFGKHEHTRTDAVCKEKELKLLKLKSNWIGSTILSPTSTIKHKDLGLKCLLPPKKTVVSYTRPPPPLSYVCKASSSRNHPKPAKIHPNSDTPNIGEAQCKVETPQALLPPPSKLGSKKAACQSHKWQSGENDPPGPNSSRKLLSLHSGQQQGLLQYSLLLPFFHTTCTHQPTVCSSLRHGLKKASVLLLIHLP